MNTDVLSDSQAVALHMKLIDRKKLLMSPKMQKYRDQLMRTAMAKNYESTRSRNGALEFKGAFDVFEEKAMRIDCKATDGTDFINDDYLKWKQRDLHLRGLDGAWLNR